jgi:hypothetical protein
VPRIGELLLAKGLLERVVLERALADQRSAQLRIVSYLIQRRLVDPDAATLALSEQRGVPAALARHIERHDPSVVPLVPSALARKWVVYPIAISRTGALIIAARDPGPLVERALEFSLRRQLLLSVAPAIEIERAVASTYGEITADATEPAESRDARALVGFELPAEPPPVEHAEQPKRSRSLSEILPASTQAEAIARARTMTNAPSAATRKALERTLEAIDASRSRDQAVERLIDYAKLRWRAALLFAIDADDATGMAHHNVDADPIESVILSVESPSTLQVAHGTRAATAKRPLGPVQDRLTTLLGTISGAAPIMVRGRVAAVLVVGATMPDTPRDSTADLDKLVDTVGAAFARHPE